MSSKKQSVAILLKSLAKGDLLSAAAEKAGIATDDAKAVLEKIAGQYDPSGKNTLEFEARNKVNSVPDFAVAYIDGGARGNPGPAGCGVVIEGPDGRTIVEDCRFLGNATNNVAEYEGLLLALERAQELGLTGLEVRSDSQLLTEQMNGRYKVKSSNLKPLFTKARAMAGEFDKIKFVHVPRQMNNRADGLANKAMDEGS